MHLILSLYNNIHQASANNPVVAGAISLWGLTVLTWIFRKVPATVLRFIVRHATSRIAFNNADVSWNDANRAQFNRFMSWFSSERWFKWSRTLSADNEGGRLIIGPGYGLHFFFYQKRFFWFYKIRLDSSGSQTEKERITLCTLGRKNAPLLEVMNQFNLDPSMDYLNVYSYSIKDNRWEFWQSARKRSLSTVCLDEGIKTRLVNVFDHHCKRRDWYEQRGLAHKLTIVLHGQPGTGKTSLIASLASTYNRRICLLNLSSMTDEKFAKAMARLPKSALVLIEDFDSTRAMLSRKANQNETVTTIEADKEKLDNGASPFQFLTLSQILNTLDGVVRLDDTIIMLTTNHLEKIDPALLRKGRVDHIIEIPLMRDPQIRAYIQMMYPESTIPDDYHFDDIAGCDIQGLFLEHKEDFDGFLNALPRQSHIGITKDVQRLRA